jgi:hypothetical protein
MSALTRLIIEELDEALGLVEWGNPAWDDNCPQCGRRAEHGHLTWCKIGQARALADAARGKGVLSLLPPARLAHVLRVGRRGKG